ISAAKSRVYWESRIPSRKIPVSISGVTPTRGLKAGFLMLVLIAACALSGFVVSTAVTGLVRRLAPRWGLIDHPGARKVHVVPTPLGGGLGIACGVIVPLMAGQAAVWLVGRGGLPADWLPSSLAVHLAGISLRWAQLWSIVAAGLLISAVGFIDDL